MRDDFAVMIFTHGRPKAQRTLTALKAYGYTGRVYLVIDDEDPTADEYRARYGDQVVQFCKRDAAQLFDIGDNFPKRNSVIYARNACHGIARSLGLRYYLALDDDYTLFRTRFNREGRFGSYRIRNLDAVIDEMLRWYIDCPRIVTLCMSQSGDFIGGFGNTVHARAIRCTRKAMNAFLCDVERPLVFSGRMNDDVNTYVEGTRRGLLFLTVMQVCLNQVQTQATTGGLTEMYRELGTYVKSFYSVMYCPSAVRVSVMGNKHPRIHHKIDWKFVAPKIIRQQHRKAQPAA